MATVVRQEKLGDSSITISFESYEDFLDYQKKEREQDDSVLKTATQEFKDIAVKVFDSFSQSQEQAYWHLQLTKEEYYYLSCILGHLVPAGEISKSLLDKVGLDDLDCEDFDRVVLSCTEIKLVENK